MNALRQISIILYRLKRTHGVAVKIRKMSTDNTDLETGRTIREYVTLDVKRGIVLPAKLIPSFAYDIAYLAANKNFTYGGIFGSSTRLVIIDGRDVPSDFKIEEDDEIIFNQAVHSIKNIVDTAQKRGYILTVTTVSSVEKIDE